MDIKKTSKVLEVGCGSGAFLYGLKSMIDCKIFGYDYSSNLINAAKKYVDGTFKQSEAIINPFKKIKFDVVFSHSVFQYFPDLEYSLSVIASMTKSLKNDGTLAVFDLNDVKFEEEYHMARAKKYNNPEDYFLKFKALNHLFFDKNIIKNYLFSKGFKIVSFVDNPIKTYNNSEFRFSLIAKKSNKVGE